MSKQAALRSALGALLAAWWGTAQTRDRLAWYDAGILAGLGLGERRRRRKILTRERKRRAAAPAGGGRPVDYHRGLVGTSQTGAFLAFRENWVLPHFR